MKASDSLAEENLLESQFKDKDEFGESSRLVDRIGSVLVGMILLAGLLLVSITAPVVGRAVSYYKFMFTTRFSDAEIPWFTEVCLFLGRFHLLELIALALAIYAYWLLRSIPDRRRANLYAGIVSLGLLAFGILVLFSSLILLIRQLSVMAVYVE